MRTHGTMSAYNAGCGCDECKQACRDATRRRRVREQTGVAPPIGREPDERTLYEQDEVLRQRRVAAGLIRVARARPAWYADAACSGQSDLFFPKGDLRGQSMNAMTADARAICARCPVADPCREQGRHDREFGVWGGESEYDRAHLGIVPDAANGKLHWLRTEAARAAAREASG